MRIFASSQFDKFLAVFLVLDFGWEGLAPRLFRANARSLDLDRGAKKPMCIILTNHLGRICSAKRPKNFSPGNSFDFGFTDFSISDPERNRSLGNV